MAKDRKKLQHIHSSLKDKQPTPATLEVGEIAVNGNAENEFLSIKNSNDKVVRFSSDSQIIEWMERKEVMPYEGQVRGEVGPTGEVDDLGSYGITNQDLLDNKSNIVIKNNQVAADNTIKHDVVNGAKDIYDKEVNPTEDGGVTDGAGFAIDMSRYAMIGANPSFSSLTVTVQTDLSGNTTIGDGASGNTYGTDTGHTLTIKTTDVVDTNTNWTETITNRTSTVANETDKITTLNESATTRNTVIGTEDLHVSGTTTEVHDGNVSIINKLDVIENTSGATTETKIGNVVENTSGSTTIDRVGDISENNKGNYASIISGNSTSTISGNVISNTSGTTSIDRKGAVTENNQSSVTMVTSGATTETKIGNVVENHSGTTIENKKGDVTENYQGNFSGNTTGTTDETKIGDVTESHSGTTTENKKGAVTENNLSTKTESTTGDKVENNSANYAVNTSGDTTFLTTGDTAIHSDGSLGLSSVGDLTAVSTEGDMTITANLKICETAGTIAAFRGVDKTNIGIDCEDGTRTTVTNVYGDTINEVADAENTTIGTATTVIGVANVSATTGTLSGSTLTVEEAASISAKTPTMNVSGSSFTIDEASTISAKTPTTTLSGTNLTINEANTVISSCTKVDIITDDLSIKQCSSEGGSADFEFCTGFDVKSNAVTFEQCDTNGTFVVNEDATTVSGITMVLDESASISAKTPTAELSGTTLNVTEATSTINSTDTNLTGTNLTIKESATTLSSTTTTVSGGTISTTSTANTTIHADGNLGLTATGDITAVSTEADIVLTANENLCATAGETAAFKGTVKTNIGKDCSDGGQTPTLNINGDTINETGSTVNISGSTSLTEQSPTTTVVGSTTLNMSGATITESGTTTNVYGATTLKMSGATINETGTTVNISGSSNLNLSGTTAVLSGNTTYISGATTLNVSGATVNVDATNYDLDASNDVCVSAAAKANFYGKATNIGIECNGTTIATATTIEGTTVGISGNTTNISGATDLKLSGETVGISGTTLNEKFTTINVSGGTINQSGSTYNITANTTNTGNLTVTGNLYLTPDCTEKVTATTVNAALCEVYDRSVITMTRVDTPSDSRLSATYKLWQNGEQIGYDIDVPKDGFLSNVELVNVSNVYYLRFTWNIYDAESHTYSTGSTDVNVEDLVKDIDDKNPSDTGTAANHNVVVDVHYDATDKKMIVSAETTPTMNVTNLYASNEISATTSVKSPTISGNNITAATKVTTKDLSVTGDAAVSGTLTLGTGLSKALNWKYGSVTGASSGSTVFASSSTDASRTITIPSSTSHLTKSALTIDYGNIYTGTKDTSYNTEAAKTITIPNSLSNVSNGKVEDTSPTDNTGQINFAKGIKVSGIVTATSAVYSSDRELKENIEYVSADEANKAANVFLRSFNFKDDEKKNKMYGVIAQEVQEAGLGDIVYKTDEGHLSVDYTSLMMLKMQYLENTIVGLNIRIEELNNKLSKFENKD